MILKSRYAWKHYPDMNTIYRNMASALTVLAKRGIENKFPDFDAGLRIAAELLEDEIRRAFNMPMNKRKYTVFVFLKHDMDSPVHTCTITTHRSMVEALESWVKDNPTYADDPKYTYQCWMEVDGAENKEESKAS